MEEKAQKVSRTPARVFLPLMNENLRPELLKLAQTLRKNLPHLSVDVYPEPVKLKNQFKFAEDSKYQWVLILGDDELKAGQIKLKDFASGQEQTIALSALPAHLKSIFI